MMRRIWVAFLAMVVALSAMPKIAGADPQDVLGEEPGIEILVADVNPAFLDAADAETSFESPLDLSYLSDSLAALPRNKERSSLPSSYDMRSLGKVSSVKNQGRTGACWAFAAMSSLESTILPHIPDASLSPYHLSWFTYSGVEEQALNFPYNPNLMGAYTRGGADGFAVGALAAWKGAVSWESAPEPRVFEESLRYEADFHLQQAYFTTPKIASDLARDEMKQLILDKGASTVTFAWDPAYLSKDGTSIYRPDEVVINHAVTIVGWDDAYSRDRFTGAAQPTADGAWLIKNSWGVGMGGEYADSGYFWLSYHDASLFSGMIYQAGPADDYATNYQYDTLGWLASCTAVPVGEQVGSGDAGKSAYAANLFTAQNNEDLQAVSFYTNDFDASYTVEVYTNVRDIHDPRSGTLMLTQQGTERYTGYHQVSLDRAVALEAGSRFSVVLRIENPRYPYPLSMEAVHMPELVSVPDGTGLGFDATGAREPSFLSADGIHWEDPYNPGKELANDSIALSNVCIKAFTNPRGVDPGTWGQPSGDQVLTDLVTKKKSEYNGIPYATVEQVPLKSGVYEYTVPVAAYEKEVELRFDGVEGAMLRTEGLDGASELAASVWSDTISLSYGETRTIILSYPNDAGVMTDYRINLVCSGALASIDRFYEVVFFPDFPELEKEYQLIAPDGSLINLREPISKFVPAPGQPAASLRLVKKGTDAPTIEAVTLYPRLDPPPAPSIDYKAETLGTLYDFGVLLSTSKDRTDHSAIVRDEGDLTPIEPGATYYLWKTATGESLASDSIEVKLPARPEPPAVLPRVTQSTVSSITLELIDGMEYYSDERGRFGASNVFSSLPSPGSEYQFAVRRGANQAAKTFASEPSAPFSAQTLPDKTPEAYRLMDDGGITSRVSDRGTWTTDWAFATLGALESNRMKQGFADTSFDLSEAALVSQTFVPRPLNENDHSAAGWYAGTPQGPDDEGLEAAFGFSYAGTWQHAVSTLARWQGAVLESEAPYRTGGLEQARAMNDDATATNGNSQVRLDTVTVLPEIVEYNSSSASDTLEGANVLKNAILSGGAVVIGAYAPENGSRYAGPGIQDPQPNKSHYTYDALWKDMRADAALLVVGWDDTYSRENFVRIDEEGAEWRPGKDGAWILKACEGESFGAGGLVWMSYDEPTLTAPVALSAEARADGSASYARNYQYDSIYPGSLYAFIGDKTFAGANVFTAQEDELLEGVGVWTSAADTEVSIEVYRNVVDPANPESGERVADAAISLVRDAGYAVVPLPVSVELRVGETFAVVISQVDGGGVLSVPVEAGYPEGDAFPAVEAGQSFVREGGKWRDVADERTQADLGFRMRVAMVGNVGVKAFANPVVSPPPTPEPDPLPAGGLEGGEPKPLTATGDAVPTQAASLALVAILAGIIVAGIAWRRRCWARNGRCDAKR